MVNCQGQGLVWVEFDTASRRAALGQQGCQDDGAESHSEIGSGTPLGAVAEEVE